MFQKGQICQIEIEDISSQGQGIGRAEGMAVFVPNTIPGDLAEIQLTKLKKTMPLLDSQNLSIHPRPGLSLPAKTALKRDAADAL